MLRWRGHAREPYKPLCTDVRPGSYSRGRNAHRSEAAQATGRHMIDRPQTISRDPSQLRLRPNLQDWAREREVFSWDALRAELQFAAPASVNIARLAVDRHAAGPRAQWTALRCLDGEGSHREVTFAQLAARSNRFANLLRSSRSDCCPRRCC